MQIKLTTNDEFDDLYNNYASNPARAALLAVEGIDRDKLDIGKMSARFFNENLSDIAVESNANANEDNSPSTYSKEIIKGVMKLNGYHLIWKYGVKRYGLRAANKLIRSILDGDVYLHDAVNIQLPYCFAFSTFPLMTEGLPYGQLTSRIPKRADSFLAQVTELIMDVSSNALVGAASPADVIVNYAWYAKRENRADYDIINDFQRLVHIVNRKFRNGESPFTNISLFDRENIKNVWKDYKYPDGTEVDVEYVMHVQKIVGDWFSKGDPSTGLPMRFPVISVNISINENKQPNDMDFLDWVCNANLEKGAFNIYLSEGNKIASCCRLSNDFSRMKARVDVFGSGGVNIGSTRIVTINLPRIALLAKGDSRMFFRLLNARLEQAKHILIVHREDILKERIERGRGFLKFFNPLKWFNLDQMFSTIGVVGVYEMNQFMGLDIMKEDGEQFTTKVLSFIEAQLDAYSEETKFSWNLEQIPAESTAVTLATKDYILFKDERIPPLYSNQFLPLTLEASLIERIKVNGKFMKKLSAGAIVHLNVEERIRNAAQMKKLVLYCIENDVEHLAINYGFAICEKSHTTVSGVTNVCPECGGNIVDTVTRIIGYFTPVSGWNKTRREYEFRRRKFMNVGEVESVISYLKEGEEECQQAV